MNDTINNKSITLNNNSNANENRIDLFKNQGGGIYEQSGILNNTASQSLFLTHTDNANYKALQLENISSAGGAIVAYANTIDTNELIIQSTNTNLRLQALSTTAGSGDIIIAPENNSGDLVFTGANIESISSSGSSGKYLRIRLNGVYYKLALDTD